jgi:hypothetical protein
MIKMKLKIIGAVILLFTVFNSQAQNLYVVNNDGTTELYSIDSVRRITIEQPNLVVLLFNGDSFSFPLASLTNYQYYLGALGIENSYNVFAEQGITVYPNPVADEFKIKLNLKQQADITYYLCDLQGRTIDKKTIQSVEAGENEFVIDASQIGNASYLIKVEINGIVYTKQIIKN